MLCLPDQHPLHLGEPNIAAPHHPTAKSPAPVPEEPPAPAKTHYVPPRMRARVSGIKAAQKVRGLKGGVGGPLLLQPPPNLHTAHGGSSATPGLHSQSIRLCHEQVQGNGQWNRMVGHGVRGQTQDVAPFSTRERTRSPRQGKPKRGTVGLVWHALVGCACALSCYVMYNAAYRNIVAQPFTQI